MEERTIDPALKVWFRPEEATAYLGIGRTRFYALLKTEAIPSVTVGRMRHIRRANLSEYMERKFACSQH